MSGEDENRAIGRLEGRMEALIKTIEAQTEKSDARSAKIYAELEQNRADIKEVRADTKDVREKLDAAAPVLSELTRWRERFIGMIIITSVVFTSLGGAIAYAWKWLAIKIGLV